MQLAYQKGNACHNGEKHLYITRDSRFEVLMCCYCSGTCNLWVKGYTNWVTIFLLCFLYSRSEGSGVAGAS